MSDIDTSAYPRLQAGVERQPARLSRQFEARGPRYRYCYDSREMPAPNHKGRGTGGGSHGDDTDSDGACLTGPQPYEGDKREFPRCVAGSLRVRVGTEGPRPPESDGRIPATLGARGGQVPDSSPVYEQVRQRVTRAGRGRVGFLPKTAKYSPGIR